MIPSRAEVMLSLFGALRLVTFRAQGFSLLPSDSGAAWRSFFALVLAAPAFLLELGSLRVDLELEPGGLHFYGVWMLTYLCLWFAFPLALLFVSEHQPFGRRVPDYIVASNWVSVPAAYVKLLGTLAGDAGALPADFVEGFALGVLLWLLANQFWLLRRRLEVPPGQAVALLLLAEGIAFAFFLWAVTRTALPDA